MFDIKVAALREHASQISHIDLAGVLRQRLAQSALAVGLPEGRLAETFTIFRTE